MRRLLLVARATGFAAILIAAVLTVLGWANPAEANHGTPVCGPLFGGITNDPNFKNQAPPIMKEPVLGAQQSCADDHLAHAVCGVAGGLEKQDARSKPLADGIRSANDGAKAVTGHECAATTTNSSTPPGGGGGGNKGGGTGAASTGGASAGGGGGTGDGAAVQGANATADGSLPRTGGELFAGAGFGLLFLGTLARRFLR